MLKLYQYIFYKLYSYMLRTPNKVNAIEGAVALLSSIELLYIVSTLMLSKLLLDFNGVDTSVTMILGLLMALLIYVLNLRYFKREISSIKSLYSRESLYQKWIGRVIVFLIGIGSVGSIIIIGILFKTKN